MFEGILVITALFVLGLGLRKFFPELCAVCFAVSAAWLAGLIVGYNPLILATLMGGSAVGLMYYLKLERFKLPFLLTAFASIHFVLLREFDWRVMAALAHVWLAFGLLRGEWLKKVVECCKNW